MVVFIACFYLISVAPFADCRDRFSFLYISAF